MSIFTIMRRMQLTAAAALLLAAGSAHAQWMWIDANGMKQVSDRPPPASVPAKSILRAPAGAAPVQDSTFAAGPIIAQAAEGKDNSVAAREADYRKRQADKAEADKKAAAEASDKTNKANACRALRTQKALLDSGQRMKSGPGKFEFMDDKTRAAESEKAGRALNEHCSQ